MRYLFFLNRLLDLSVAEKDTMKQLQQIKRKLEKTSGMEISSLLGKKVKVVVDLVEQKA